MNKKQRKEIALVLELSKKYLWDGVCQYYAGYGNMECIPTGNTEYICHALDKASNNNLEYRDSVEKIKSIISKRLGKYETLIEWLKENGVDNVNLTYLNVQAHRLAWINLLIKEFST